MCKSAFSHTKITHLLPTKVCGSTCSNFFVARKSHVRSSVRGDRGLFRCFLAHSKTLLLPFYTLTTLPPTDVDNRTNGRCVKSGGPNQGNEGPVVRTGHAFNNETHLPSSIPNGKNDSVVHTTGSKRRQSQDAYGVHKSGNKNVLDGRRCARVR